MAEMSISEFNPFVRFCSEVNLRSTYSEAVIAYDFRLFYAIEGGFIARFENESIAVKKNGLLLLPPATPYRIEPLESGGSKHIILNFDMVSENIGTPSMAPVSIGEFDHERVYSYKTFSPFDTVFFLENAYFCEGALNEMCKEMRNKEEDYTQVISGELKCLLVRVMREKSRCGSNSGSEAASVCFKVAEYIRKECTSAIDNGSIGERFGYHPYYLNRIFKKNMGCTLREYAIKCRISIACELLLRSEKSVAEIGGECGFCSPAYFTEVFSKRMGVTPHEYRKKAK